VLNKLKYGPNIHQLPSEILTTPITLMTYVLAAGLTPFLVAIGVKYA